MTGLWTDPGFAALAGRSGDSEKTLLQHGARISDPKELKHVCQEFESVFLQKLWQEMKKTVPRSGLWHDRMEEHYLSMFDQEFSRKMAQSGGIGLADLLYRQLSRQLEEASTGSASGDPASQVIGKEKMDNAYRTRSAGQNSPVCVDQEGLTEAMHRDPRLVRLEVDLLAREIEEQADQCPEDKTVHLSPVKYQVSEPCNVLVPDSQTDATALPLILDPVCGQVSSGFGWRTDPFTGKREFHPGLDYAVPEGTDVHACWPGRVVFAGERSGYGNLVILAHAGGWRSYYAHLSSMDVQEGQVIGAGVVLGKSGNTGLSTGPHLHFEIRQGKVAWDPRQLKSRMLAGLSLGRRV